MSLFSLLKFMEVEMRLCKVLHIDTACFQMGVSETRITVASGYWFNPEPGTSGLEKTAPSSELEFFSRSI